MIVILYYLIYHSLLNVLFSHSTILLIKNRNTTFTSNNITGPINFGILMYASFVVKNIIAKLAINNRKHKKLNKTKFIISLLLADMFTQIRSFGYCAHLTIILLSATFHIASSLAYPI